MTNDDHPDDELAPARGISSGTSAKVRGAGAGAKPSRAKVASKRASSPWARSLAAAPRVRGRTTGLTVAGETPVTVRMDERELLDPLTALAMLDSSALADQIRYALEVYLARRMIDPTLPDAIRAMRARQDAMLSTLDPDANTEAPASVKPAAAVRAKRRGPTKPVTVRLDDTTLSRLTAFALIDDTTLAVQICEAAEDYIGERTSDSKLAAQIDAARARHEDALSVLSV